MVEESAVLSTGSGVDINVTDEVEFCRHARVVGREGSSTYDSSSSLERDANEASDDTTDTLRRRPFGVWLPRRFLLPLPFLFRPSMTLRCPSVSFVSCRRKRWMGCTTFAGGSTVVMHGVSETNKGGMDVGRSAFTAACTLVVSASAAEEESSEEAEKTTSDNRFPDGPPVWPYVC